MLKTICVPCRLSEHHDCEKLVLDTQNGCWRCCCWLRVPKELTLPGDQLEPEL